MKEICQRCANGAAARRYLIYRSHGNLGYTGKPGYRVLDRVSQIFGTPGGRGDTA